MQIRGKYTSLADYIFWIVFLIFTNPAGILNAFGENSGSGGVNVTDILFAILVACYLFIFRKNDLNGDKSYNKTIKYIFIFSLYYLIVFGFFVPLFKNSPNYNFLVTTIKNRYAIISIVLVVMIYKFYLRSYPIFFKLFLYSSVVLISLFILSVITGLEILPVLHVERRFVNATRLVMIDYGLMPLLIPMGVIVLIFKFDIKYKTAIIVGSLLMFIAWVLALFRRHIFGAFFYFLIASFLNNFIDKKALIPLKKFFVIIFYLIVVGFILQLSFPKYVDSTIRAVQESIYIMKHGESTLGKRDSRMGLGTEFLQNKIVENPFFGTGFDNNWRTGEGDASGYEASDYPFLGALAMIGIVGLLFFLPIYLVLIKALIFDIKYLRNHKLNEQSFDSYILILFIVYFVFDLLQYMNWFLPISIISDEKWYVFLAMYLASRKIFYEKKSKIIRPTFK